jgi:hypothetical protein
MTLFTPEMLSLLEAEARYEADDPEEAAEYARQQAIARRIMTGAVDVYMTTCEDCLERSKVTSEAEMRAFAQKYGSGQVIIVPLGKDGPITPIGKFDQGGALCRIVLSFILPRPECDADVEIPSDEELTAGFLRGDYNLWDES